MPVECARGAPVAGDAGHVAHIVVERVARDAAIGAFDLTQGAVGIVGVTGRQARFVLAGFEAAFGLLVADVCARVPKLGVGVVEVARYHSAPRVLDPLDVARSL